MADDAPTPSPRSHRGAVRALLIGGTILAVLAIFAVFANRQALDADNWADTSGALLENTEVRQQLSAFLVDEAYANVDVAAEVRRALPPRLEPLAGPAANGLRELAETRMNRLLERPVVQDAWKEANRLTAEQLIRVAEGKSEVVTTSGGAVILNLRVLVVNLVERLGLPRALADKVPPDAGQIRVMSSSQVDTVQSTATLIRVLSFLLPVLALGMLGLAIYLDRGHRRQTLLVVGIDLIIAGVLVLALRNIAGQSLVEALAPTDSVQPAVQSVWDIGSRMLRDAAQACVIVGIPLVLAAILAGPLAPAVGFRRAVAPYLRDRPDITYGVVAGLVALVVAWGPIPATRMLIPVLLMIAVVIIGVQELRAQTAREFPDATPAATRAALSRAFTLRRARNGHDHEAGRVEQLERLTALHDRGALTDAEFEAEKRTLTIAGAH